MKQRFNKKIHEKFIKKFKVADIPGKWDIAYLFKTRKYLGYIKWIPGLKMIGVGNSISMNAGKQGSDIDLFIVTDENRMWLVRILVTTIFQLLGVRKTDKKHAGRFCLSFFSTTALLDFSDFAIKNDVYLYFWIVYFKPILDYNKTYDYFLEENKSWADFSSYDNIISENKSIISFTKESKKQNFAFKYVLDQINSLLKFMFLGKTKKSFRKLGKPFGVIIDDDMLKFHDKDIREIISSELIKNQEV